MTSEKVDNYGDQRAAYARGWLAADRHASSPQAETVIARMHTHVLTLDTSDVFVGAWVRGYRDGLSEQSTLAQTLSVGSDAARDIGDRHG